MSRRGNKVEWKFLQIVAWQIIHDKMTRRSMASTGMDFAKYTNNKYSMCSNECNIPSMFLMCFYVQGSSITAYILCLSQMLFFCMQDYLAQRYTLCHIHIFKLLPQFRYPTLALSIIHTIVFATCTPRVAKY